MSRRGFQAWLGRPGATERSGDSLVARGGVRTARPRRHIAAMTPRALITATWCALALALTSAGVSLQANAQPSVDLSLDRAHAHNDYNHARPLLDALDRGFGSIEADIWLVNGALLVAHDRDSVRMDRTLEALYLAPLRARIAAGEGRVYPQRAPLTLLIDVKSHADSTWTVLEPLLRQYDDVITSWHGDSMTTRPVIAVISGKRPLGTLATQRVRWAGLDGRLADLDVPRRTTAASMPLVSDDWKNITKWRGNGPVPSAVRRRVVQAVTRAHAQGRRLRFWNTPDLPAVWKLLLDSGVDLIGADDLDALRLFLSSARKASP